ncbi:5-aminolevulinate synthase [Streptomyces sp. TRM64462]|uniref:5-aminolevulinate synthase n=1 Tax=Streptomyces sp. TRM64462 TaxID=2741726 RepID=UPI0015869304|nr:5-aminolevulinate synthase [Streptomyces sp. TRM64462]
MTASSLRETQPAFVTFDEKLRHMKSNGLYRSYFPTAHMSGSPGQTLHHGEEIEVWCTNDYLGLSQHPELIRAQIDSTALHGTSMGGSRNIAGTSTTHAELEQRLARWHGKERALVFSSGYVANFESLSVLLAEIPGIVAFSDEHNHRSLIEGIRRAHCEKRIFPHNDLDALEEQLAACDPDRPKLIVFESVYSMDADLSPVSRICDLADRYNAMTYLDETHAIGAMGPTGAGLCEAVGETRPTFVQGVFGKALGTVGGYVAGPDTAVDFIRSHAPGFIFTTSLPQACMDATLKALELVRNGDDLRHRLTDRSLRMKAALRDRDIPFLDAAHHIIPVMIPGSERVRRVTDLLLEKHRVYVQPINFPSVPLGTERLRVTVPPYRTDEQIDGFAQALQDCLANA